MIASGKTVSDIAEEMCLSVKTVSTYRSRILDKMKLKNNAEMTTYAIRNKLGGVGYRVKGNRVQGAGSKIHRDFSWTLDPDTLSPGSVPKEHSCG